MHLAFPAWRRGFFKATGGPITEALRRGHQVSLLHGAAGKPGETVTTAELRARWPQISLAVPPVVDAVLGPSLHAYAARLPRARQAYTLDLAWEGASAPAGQRMHHCWASAHQRACWVLAHGGSPDVLPAIWADTVTGSPMMDVFDTAWGGRQWARPQIVLMALKFPRNAGLWRRLVYRTLGYRHLVRALRRLCDRLGADLLVKTRAKNNDPWWLGGYAAQVVTDTALWPYTAAEVIRRAVFVVHFQSGAALEAAFAGVPQLSIHLPQPHLAQYPGHREQYEASPGMQAWPGVVTGIGWETAVGYLDTLAALPTVDRAARAAYVTRFLGFDDCRTSPRILDVVERQVVRR